MGATNHYAPRISRKPKLNSTLPRRTSATRVITHFLDNKIRDHRFEQAGGDAQSPQSEPGFEHPVF
jgi:hypothetical protein